MSLKGFDAIQHGQTVTVTHGNSTRCGIAKVKLCSGNWLLESYRCVLLATSENFIRVRYNSMNLPPTNRDTESAVLERLGVLLPLPKLEEGCYGGHRTQPKQIALRFWSHYVYCLAYPFGRKDENGNSGYQAVCYPELAAEVRRGNWDNVIAQCYHDAAVREADARG